MQRVQLAELRDLIADAAEHLSPAASPFIVAAADLLDYARQAEAGAIAELGEPLARIAPQALGLLVRERRAEASMSLHQLAKRARLAIGTVRSLEKGRRAPTVKTLAAIARVPELRLAEPTAGRREQPNSYLPLLYDRLKLLGELRATLNSPGGHLEQTCLYLDDSSAMDWLSICTSPGYLEANRALPLRAIAQTLAQGAARGLDVIALGPGDGQTEVAFCKELLSTDGAMDLSILLLDISHTLLTVAHQRARTELSPRGVRVESLHGDFHHLGRYAVLHQRAGSARRRCYTLLGNTLANLDHEARFVRDGLSTALPGDFMLVDFSLAFADVEDPDGVRRAEPVLNRPISPPFARWLGGLVSRYSADLRSFTLGTDLMTECAIPGSYEIGYFADVVLQDGQERRYYLARARRYDRGRLLAAFARHGWREVQVLPHGPGARGVLALLQRVG